MESDGHSTTETRWEPTVAAEQHRLVSIRRLGSVVSTHQRIAGAASSDGGGPTRFALRAASVSTPWSAPVSKARRSGGTMTSQTVDVNRDRGRGARLKNRFSILV